ncbi:glycosyltransferase family 4 protein, partial [Escherichia coli]|nr:glycosyltransferase family 4 protein [Escherichia coli]
YYYYGYLLRLLKKDCLGTFKFRPILKKILHDVDCFMFFNDIGYLDDNDWISFFETTIPRLPSIKDIHRDHNDKINYPRLNEVKTDLESLVHENCKRLIAISNSAFEIQSTLLKSYPEYKDIILNKTEVIHPPQRLLFKDKLKSTKFKFIFVGNDFYRKGGGEVVLAFQKLIKEYSFLNKNVSLILIGDLNRKYNYVHGEFQFKISYFKQIEDIIYSSNNIRLYTNISNMSVLKLMSESSVGILPTWGDTYGYSVLEMQSFGLPVITSNVRALPEINHNDLIFNVDTNILGEIVIDSFEQRDAISEKIIDGVKKKMEYILLGDNKLHMFSEWSIDNIRTNHDPDIFYKKILNIIDEKR